MNNKLKRKQHEDRRKQYEDTTMRDALEKADVFERLGIEPKYHAR